MKSVFVAALAWGLGAASMQASAQDAPRQLGGAPVVPTPAARPAAPPPRQLDAVPAPAAPSVVAAPDSARRAAPVATTPAPVPTPEAASPVPVQGPPAQPGQIMGGSTRPARYQVGLKNGMVYNVYDVEVKSPLFGRQQLLLDGRQRVDMAAVGFYEDQTGHYVRTTLPNSSRESTLRREKTGRISLYATYSTSYSSSPYGSGFGMGGFGYGGMGGYPYGMGGYPYGGYRTTKTEYFSKDNGPIQNLSLHNLALATTDNAGAQELLAQARRYRQSSVVAYVVGGGLLVAGLVQSVGTNSQGISPLFYAAVPVLIVPLIFQGKQAAAQRQAIAIYNSGRQ